MASHEKDEYGEMTNREQNNKVGKTKVSYLRKPTKGEALLETKGGLTRPLPMASLPLP